MTYYDYCRVCSEPLHSHTELELHYSCASIHTLTHTHTLNHFSSHHTVAYCHQASYSDWYPHCILCFVEFAFLYSLICWSCARSWPWFWIISAHLSTCSIRARDSSQLQQIVRIWCLSIISELLEIEPHLFHYTLVYLTSVQINLWTALQFWITNYAI